MLLDHEHIRADAHRHLLAEVAAGLPRVTTSTQACQAVVSALGRHTPARITALLRVDDRLRCVAATGAWHVFASIVPGAGLAGRVYSSGRTEIVTDVRDDPDHIPLGPDPVVTICTPIVDGGGRPLGVLDLEWANPVDLDAWRTTAEQVAARLGARIAYLGGRPRESRSEKLLRHVMTLTDAATEPDLMAATAEAARDVSGLSAAVLVAGDGCDPLPEQPAAVPDALETRMRARLADVGPDTLSRLIQLTHRYGTLHTLGERGHPPAAGYDVFVAAGAGTLIAAPVGPPDAGGVLLVADEEALRPDPTTVNLIELLAAQAWICLDRLRSLRKLHERASSDPLTGLRHHGPFGERVAAATPDRTALLAIDVDNFKMINDTYGHQVGDQVLVDLARALQAALRHGDELFRVGGDEFIAVVEVTRSEEAMGIAQRLATAARQTGRTISVGVAVQCGGESAELTRRRADAALYQAKRDGRDGVRLARPCPSQRTGR